MTGVSATEEIDYAYDFENRLNELTYINIPGISGTQYDYLSYTGEGLRTQASINSVTSNYSYDGANILDDKDSSWTTTQSYTRGLDYGGGINSLIAQNNIGTSTTQYYQYNDLGSVSNLTSSTGTAYSSYPYDAYGNLLTTPASGDMNRYFFSTKEFDYSRSGLQYFGARYYDPEIGRWLTPDPLGFVDGLNVYAYVGDNPENVVDPLGLYGTTNCSYYEKQCEKYGGQYYCHDAPQACSWFNKPFFGPSNNPNPTNNGYEGWQRCTRQCLQDCDAAHDKNGGSSTQQCGEHKDDGNGNGPNNNFWDSQNLMCHVECYISCTNPITAPKGGDTPDNS